MAATTNKFLTREAVHLVSRNRLPVAAATRFFQDTLIGMNGAAARPLQKGDKFAGIASAEVDNRDGAAGALLVESEMGVTIVANVAGVTGHGDFGKTVYASDDETLTLTAADNVAVGTIKRYEGTGTKAAVRLYNENEAGLA